MVQSVQGASWAEPGCFECAHEVCLLLKDGHTHLASKIIVVQDSEAVYPDIPGKESMLLLSGAEHDHLPAVLLLVLTLEMS